MLGPLPIEVDSFQQGNAAGFAGAGSDGFSLYAALRDASLLAGGTGPMLVSWPFDPRWVLNTGGTPLTDQRLMLMPQLVKGGVPITGVAWVQTTQGNYTANNNNKVGAYTYDGNQFTRVAQSANISAAGQLWKSAAGYQQQSFTAAYTPPADMLLWAAGIWCNSAVVTAPVIVGNNLADAGSKNLGLIVGGTPGYGLGTGVVGATDLTATILDAALTNTFTNHYWLAFYHQY